ncbi:MAG TPA: DUF3311 domain-containing protein [Planctomycetota bacterium]|nr:DUF3311 domain-containing protein [Planctomycetota bacterium]
MKPIVIVLVVLLIIAHQDFWWWDDRTIVLGFLPIGLAWHILISLATAAVGVLAVMCCWPKDLEENESDSAPPPEGGGPR